LTWLRAGLVSTSMFINACSWSRSAAGARAEVEALALRSSSSSDEMTMISLSMVDRTGRGVPARFLRFRGLCSIAVRASKWSSRRFRAHLELFVVICFVRWVICRVDGVTRRLFVRLFALRRAGWRLELRCSFFDHPAWLRDAR
jgi:hypothetical protein